MIQFTLFCTSQGTVTRNAHEMCPEGDTGVVTQQLTKLEFAVWEGSVHGRPGLTVVAWPGPPPTESDERRVFWVPSAQSVSRWACRGRL